MKKTLQDWLLGVHAWPVNPMIRWTPGDRESLRIESGLHDLPDGESELEADAAYFGDGDWDAELSESEWNSLADWFVTQE